MSGHYMDAVRKMQHVRSMYGQQRSREGCVKILISREGACHRY